MCKISKTILTIICFNIIGLDLSCSDEKPVSSKALSGFFIGTPCDDYSVSAAILDGDHALLLGRVFSYNCGITPAIRIFLAKTISVGDTIWNRLIPDSISLDPAAMAVAGNGEIIICGTAYLTSPMLFLIKTDPNGLVIWKKIFPSIERAQSVKIANDGNYLIATNSLNYEPPYYVGVVKFDTSGTLMWEKKYARDRNETANMEVFPSGCLLVTNYNSYGEINDYSCLFRMNSNGDTLWTKTLDSINVAAIYKDNDSIYVLVGNNNKLFLGQNTYTVQLRKIDSHGNVLLSNSVKVNRYGLINSVVETPDSSFLLAGSWNGSKPILMKWDRQGKWVWTKLIEDQEWVSDYKIYPRQDYRYLLIGTSGNDAESDIRIIAIDENGNPE